jgi:hypothetical protein
LWAAIGIALRVSVDRENRQSKEHASGSDEQADVAEEFPEPNFVDATRMSANGA